MFLHGDLTKTMVMTQTRSFSHPAFLNHVYQFQNAPYGLKQALHAWYAHLSSTLLQLGFINSKSNTLLFIYWLGQELIYILVYVDDFLVIGPNKHSITHLKLKLKAKFELKELGPLNYFLGVAKSTNVLMESFSLSRNTSGNYFKRKTWLMQM